MINLRTTFLGAIYLTHITYLCLFVNLYLIESIGELSTQIQEINKLREMPQTKCRLVIPFTHEIKEKIAYVPVEYLGLNKTYESGTLIYPVIVSKDDNILQWLLSLPSDFDCRLMISTPNTVFNILPSDFSISIWKDLQILCSVGILFVTLMVGGIAWVLSCDLLQEFKRIKRK